VIIGNEKSPFQNILMQAYAQNPLYARFPVTYPERQVTNLLATSHFNAIRETTRHNRHNAPTCYELVTHLLRENWCNGFWS